MGRWSRKVVLPGPVWAESAATMPAVINATAINKITEVLFLLDMISPLRRRR